MLLLLLLFFHHSSFKNSFSDINIILFLTFRICAKFFIKIQTNRLKKWDSAYFFYGFHPISFRSCNLLSLSTEKAVRQLSLQTNWMSTIKRAIFLIPANFHSGIHREDRHILWQHSKWGMYTCPVHGASWRCSYDYIEH